MSPSRHPTALPVTSPTNAPSCSDNVGYCTYLVLYCNSTDVSVLTKVQNDCTFTCGLCTRGIVEHPTFGSGISSSVQEPTYVPTREPDARRRLTNTERSGPLSEKAILLVISSILLLCIMRRIHKVFFRTTGVVENKSVSDGLFVEFSGKDYGMRKTGFE